MEPSQRPVISNLTSSRPLHLPPITQTRTPQLSYFRPRRGLFDLPSVSDDDDASSSESSPSSWLSGNLSADSVSSLTDSKGASSSSNSFRPGGGGLFSEASGSRERYDRPNTKVLLYSLRTSPPKAVKLSLAIARARQALSALSFEALSNSLKSLSAVIPVDTSTLGSFVPILARLAFDLEEILKAEEFGKEYRRTLGKEEAKALVALRQRWSGGNKGKGKETEEGWVGKIREAVERVSEPVLVTLFSRKLTFSVRL